MTPEEKRFLDFYDRYRKDEQARWYRNRYTTYEAAHRQTVGLASIVLFLSAVASILSTAEGDEPFHVWREWVVAWPVLAAVLAAAGTAIGAYRTLYGFQENSRLYRDAENALAFVGADSPDDCENCPDAPALTPGQYALMVEQVFRREQSQWGQLVSQARAAVGGEQPDTGADPAPPKGADQAAGGNNGEGGGGANDGNDAGNGGGAGAGGGEAGGGADPAAGGPDSAANGGTDQAAGGTDSAANGGTDQATGGADSAANGGTGGESGGTTTETFTAGPGGTGTDAPAEGGSGAGSGETAGGGDSAGAEGTGGADPPRNAPGEGGGGAGNEPPETDRPV